jgi:hypothetical protein
MRQLSLLDLLNLFSGYCSRLLLAIFLWLEGGKMKLFSLNQAQDH